MHYIYKIIIFFAAFTAISYRPIPCNQPAEFIYTISKDSVNAYVGHCRPCAITVKEQAEAMIDRFQVPDSGNVIMILDVKIDSVLVPD